MGEGASVGWTAEGRAFWSSVGGVLAWFPVEGGLGVSPGGEDTFVSAGVPWEGGAPWVGSGEALGEVP